MTDTKDLISVRVIGIPVDLWLRSTSHWDGLQREFDIIRHSQTADSVPNRVIKLNEELRERYSGYGDPANAELRAAAEAGLAQIDLVYNVPPAVGEAARQLQRMLEEAEAYCREEMITHTASPEVQQFREWFLGEFIRQIEDKAPPLPWSPPRAPTSESDSDEAGASRSGLLTVSGEIDLASAGGLRERIFQLINDGIRALTLDLTDVSFLDSVGLGLLVATHQRLSEDGHALAVIVPSHLDTLFEVSGLKGVFDIRPGSARR